MKELTLIKVNVLLKYISKRGEEKEGDRERG